ncbi:MAG: AlpA family phage regulatory protein [Pseudomonadota bacterium]
MGAQVSVKPAYLEIHDACSFVALKKSTLETLVREDKFPKPRQISGRRVAWLVRELEEWAESRPVSEQLPPDNTGAKKPASQH